MSPSARNPPWSRDELILALDLYMRHRASPPGKTHPEVVQLSRLLNTLGARLHPRALERYRNPSGVYLKLMNFRRLDPEYTRTGKVGMTHGNADEPEVW
jgi:predicted HNH restriction endonuclease